MTLLYFLPWRIDDEIDDRKELEAIISLLDAFLAKKQIKRMAASA